VYMFHLNGSYIIVWVKNYF